MSSGTALKHYIPLIFLAPAVLESNWEKNLCSFPRWMSILADLLVLLI